MNMYAIQSDLVTVSSNSWLSKFGMMAVLKVDYYDLFPRVIQEDLLFTIKVKSQYRSGFLSLDVLHVDSITLLMLPLSQFLILEIGLMTSCLCHEAKIIKECTMCAIL